MLADSVGPALLAVLDTLSPAERLAFVLHDIFDVPFHDITPIVDRSPAAVQASLDEDDILDLRPQHRLPTTVQTHPGRS
jgi:DNA-directed RNA polymerase specialized sigma24 family protein